jgi:glutathione S-transferase
MSLKLYFHPLSSFCMKVLIALYENDTPFAGEIVNLGDAASRDAFKKVWPIGKFPVLHDDVKDRTIPESNIIIEYLDQHYAGKTRFIPADAELARQVRFQDRFYDLHLHIHMQKVVGDWLRPADKRDPLGVEQAKALIQTALGMADKEMAAKTWCMGNEFTLADCSAAPALFYIDKAMPFADTHKNAHRYLERLKSRPSFARALTEAEPYFEMFPIKRAVS